MKAVVATFNQEKALVGAFSMITNLRMDLFEALILSRRCHDCHEAVTMLMQVGDYPALERDAEAGFYFTSPALGQLMPRLPNTVNLGFIHCRCGHSRAVT